MPSEITSRTEDSPEIARLNFIQLVDNMPTSYMVMDRQLRIVYANRAYLDMVERELDQLQDKYIFDSFPDTPERVSSVKEVFLKTFEGVTTRLDRQEFLFEHADGTTETKCWQCVQTPYFDENGQVSFILQHSEDITESEKLRRKNEAISLELDHRVKNVFATIQAVAALAGQNSNDINEYREDFEARIMAMSRTHDALSRRDWAGLSLKQIFCEAIAQYASLDSSRVNFHGVDAILNPRASQMASLLTHEFATNAAKYGCFSTPEGRLDLTIWPDPKSKSLKAEWKESGMSGIKPSSRRGFGTQLEQFMPNVTIDREFEDDGIRITIWTMLLKKPLEYLQA